MEEEKYVQLGKSTNVLRLWIKTEDGVKTGDYLEFKMKDIELLDRYQKMQDEFNKNQQWIQNQFVIIDKKQDFTKKGKLMSNNQEMTYNAIREYYKRQKKVFDMFLGDGGVDKLLYGRPFEWETLKEINKLIEEQILPYLDITMDNIKKEIKDKYNVNVQSDVLE